MDSFFFPFTFGEILNISNAYGRYSYNKQMLEIERRKYDSSFKNYKSQIDLNNDIMAFNFSQRVKSAANQAASLEAAFARAGIYGGTLSDSLENYSNNVLISSING